MPSTMKLPERFLRYEPALAALRAQYDDLIVSEDARHLWVGRTRRKPDPCAWILETVSEKFSYWDNWESRGHSRDWIVSQLVALLRDKC